MILITNVVILMPYPAILENHECYSAVFSPIFSLYIANILGSFLAFFLNASLFSFLHKIREVKFVISFNGLGHFSIVVDNISSAIDLYVKIFNASPKQLFRNFQNVGFAKSAGFLTDPKNVNVSIAFLEIPNTGVFLELMEYHSPSGKVAFEKKATNDIGGVGHICLRVKKIDEAFKYIKACEGVTLINTSPEYKPYKIDEIKSNEFNSFNKEDENNVELKSDVCQIVGNIRYFYFIDKYGVQWEFEEGHDDIGNE